MFARMAPKHEPIICGLRGGGSATNAQPIVESEAASHAGTHFPMPPQP